MPDKEDLRSDKVRYCISNTYVDLAKEVSQGKRIDVLDSFFCVITEENVADLSTLYEKIMGEKSILPIGKVLFFYPNRNSQMQLLVQ